MMSHRRASRRWALCALGIVATATAAGPRSALDPGQHDTGASYRSDYEAAPIRLDATLPWVERFEPDGAFDPRFSLDSPAESAPTMAPKPAVETPAALDARGTVKDIRVDAGKLKIDHGPIDRHGMPAMTMMFNVADPSMMEGIAKGDEIEFNVDMGAAGFTITEIRRPGDSQ